MVYDSWPMSNMSHSLWSIDYELKLCSLTYSEGGGTSLSKISLKSPLSKSVEIVSFSKPVLSIVLNFLFEFCCECAVGNIEAIRNKKVFILSLPNQFRFQNVPNSECSSLKN